MCSNHNIPAIIPLSCTRDKSCVQITESVSLIAELDFCERWPNLIICQWTNKPNKPHSHSTSNNCSETATMDINLGVLEAAHSILSQWRSCAHSDAFWLVIKPVHSKFLHPYCPHFEMIIEPLLAMPDPVHRPWQYSSTYTMTLHVKDLAPEFEDHHARFSTEGTGYFTQLMRVIRHSSRWTYVVVASFCLCSEPLLAIRTNAITTVKDTAWS